MPDRELYLSTLSLSGVRKTKQELCLVFKAEVSYLEVHRNGHALIPKTHVQSV